MTTHDDVALPAAHDRVVAAVQRVSPTLAATLPALGSTSSQQLTDYHKALCDHLFTGNGSNHPRWLDLRRRHAQLHRLALAQELVTTWYRLVGAVLRERDPDLPQLLPVDMIREGYARVLRACETPTIHADSATSFRCVCGNRGDTRQQVGFLACNGLGKPTMPHPDGAPQQWICTRCGLIVDSGTYTPHTVEVVWCAPVTVLQR